MKSFTVKALAVFVFALLCAAVFPTAAQASPSNPGIGFVVENVVLNKRGEAEITGYFLNPDDHGEYAKWIDLNLTLIATDGQEMWSGAGFRHPVNDIYVASYERVAYTFRVRNPDIPEYHDDFRVRWHTDTVSGKNAG